MNERIKELYIQACEQNYSNNMAWEELNVEKFAELIVEECLLCCERTISDPVPESVDTFEQGGIHCMDEIRQHFGIGMSTADKKTLIKELLGVGNERKN
jgi:hypothetical protein